jgi:hypothetical protein
VVLQCHGCARRLTVGPGAHITDGTHGRGGIVPGRHGCLPSTLRRAHAGWRETRTWEPRRGVAVAISSSSPVRSVLSSCVLVRKRSGLGRGVEAQEAQEAPRRGANAGEGKLHRPLQERACARAISN